jgi:NAD(P)H-hydrate epimerase
MCHGISDAGDLAGLLQRATVVAFGPGLGQSDWAKDLFEVMRDVETLSVWDADALNLLATAPSTMEQRVITPHPGEAARLLGTSARSVQADRRAALGSLQEKYGGVAVLKGANTLVSSRRGVPWLCVAGNPGMATAGMGDVLTGVISAMLGQGLAPEMAAAAGVEVHARAGDQAAALGERGLIATDLLAELRGIVNP